jgi:hypothetical protein
VNILVLDDGSGLRGYDCREVLGIEEIQDPESSPPEAAFVVRLGRLGRSREIRCRQVLGFFPLAPKDVRPLPAVLAERMGGDEAPPWAVGIVESGLCLLY